MAPLRENERRSPRLLWLWAAGVVAAAIVVAFIGWYGHALWVYANHDVPELIDDPSVVSVIERSCAEMTLAVTKAATPQSAAAHVSVEAIRTQDAAVARMVAEVRGVGQDTVANDRPTEDWLSDWELLAAARERSAESLARGTTADFEVPRVDGRPITTRMDEQGVCPVPLELMRVG